MTMQAANNTPERKEKKDKPTRANMCMQNATCTRKTGSVTGGEEAVGVGGSGN